MTDPTVRQSQGSFKGDDDHMQPPPLSWRTWQEVCPGAGGGEPKAEGHCPRPRTGSEVLTCRPGIEQQSRLTGLTGLHARGCPDNHIKNVRRDQISDTFSLHRFKIVLFQHVTNINIISETFYLFCIKS